LVSTVQPNTRRLSASIAYRKRPSALRPSSRRPFSPWTARPAAASSRVRLPSSPIAYRETAPSAKFVVNA
jgi:hypothetical protein